MKLNPSIITSTENTTQKIISENNFSTSQSETVFQYLMSIYKKHNSQSVDEAMMFFITSRMADTLNAVFRFKTEKSNAKEEPIAFGERITNEIHRYNGIVSDQLFKYFKAFPEIASIGSENKIKDAKSFSDLVFPNYLSICPSTIAEVYNWEILSSIDYRGRLPKEKTAGTRENIYDLVLQELDHSDCLINTVERCGAIITLVDILNAFFRYQLYHHTSMHRLYYNNFQILVKSFSDLYSLNLRRKFVKCDCCNEISRDQNKDFMKFD